MAKAKGAAKVKAKAQPQSEARKRQRYEEHNAIYQAGDGPAVAKKQKHEDILENGTLEALRDNFKGFTYFHLRMVFDKDGNAIYDRVFERQLAKMMDAKLLCGKNFYRDLNEECFGKKGWTAGVPTCATR